MTLFVYIQTNGQVLCYFDDLVPVDELSGYLPMLHHIYSCSKLKQDREAYFLSLGLDPSQYSYSETIYYIRKINHTKDDHLIKIDPREIKHLLNFIKKT
jgi:hypothetical protein